MPGITGDFYHVILLPMAVPGYSSVLPFIGSMSH